MPRRTKEQDFDDKCKIIDEITSKYPYIYDKGMDDYKDTPKKNEAFARIGDLLGETGKFELRILLCTL